MVKYASKPEKSSQTYIEILKTILTYSSEEDDPKTKLRIRYNPLNIQNQIIKYSPWDNSNLSEINNFETAIQRFEYFIKISPPKIIYSLSFFNEFLKVLKKLRDDLENEPDVDMLATEYTELSCAPTAKAAFIIRGETFHSLFDIKVDNENQIVSNEYSMLSQRLFGLIDNRLRAIKANNSFFGGVSIILVGDPGQLLPVCGAPLNDSKSHQPYSLDGFMAYNEFKIVVKLEQLERQKVSNDIRQHKFIDLLPRCRNGENTIEDWELLLENSTSPSNIYKFFDSIRLFLENDIVDTYNNQKLCDLKNPIMSFLALNSTNSIKRLQSVQCSLLNSANGIIKDIIVSDDYLPGDIPIAIIVEVPHYTGPQFFNDPNRKNHIPINSTTFFTKSVFGSRTQIPLRLGYAMTIQKSQGQTLNSAVIDLGKSEKSLG
ncbi:unnamed protein product, partial [Brachionus calyciflorus]